MIITFITHKRFLFLMQINNGKSATNIIFIPLIEISPFIIQTTERNDCFLVLRSLRYIQEYI